jgi:hypothetical protein
MIGFHSKLENDNVSIKRYDIDWAGKTANEQVDWRNPHWFFAIRRRIKPHRL